MRWGYKVLKDFQRPYLVRQVTKAPPVIEVYMDTPDRKVYKAPKERRVPKDPLVPTLNRVRQDTKGIPVPRQGTRVTRV